MANATTAAATGKFVWYDILTTDPKAGEAFYKSVMDWNVRDAGMPDRTYSVLSVGDVQVGGLMPVPPDALKMGMKPTWMGYIGVVDIDDMARRVKAAGGAVHRGPEEIPGVGKMAVAADPFGAAFLLFQPGSIQQPAPVAHGTPGFVGWRELHAGDGVAAFEFYSGLFGWTKSDALDMGPMGVYQIFAIDGQPAGGMMTKAAHVPVAKWSYVFNVDAIDAAAARVRNAGGKITMEPHEVPGGQWVIRCSDPQGAEFSLVAFKR